MTLVQHPVLQEHQTSTSSSSSQLRVCAPENSRAGDFSWKSKQRDSFPNNTCKGCQDLILPPRACRAHRNPSCNFFPPKKASFSKVVASNHSKKPFQSVSLRKVQKSELQQDPPCRAPNTEIFPPHERALSCSSLPEIFHQELQQDFPQTCPAKEKCGWMCWAKAALLQQNSEVHQRFFKLSLSHPGRRQSPKSITAFTASQCLFGGQERTAARAFCSYAIFSFLRGIFSTAEQKPLIIMTLIILIFKGKLHHLSQWRHVFK